MGIVKTVFAAFMLLICGSALAQPAETPKDFALRLEFGCGGIGDVIDTFNGKYVRNPGTRVESSARFTLSRGQKAELYQLVIQSGFFEYPSLFRPVNLLSEPSLMYRLEVRSAAVRHFVSWDDIPGSAASASPEAQRLRILLKRVIDMVRALPDVKSLPEDRGLCM